MPSNSYSLFGKSETKTLSFKQVNEMREKEIEGFLVKCIKHSGGLALKFNSTSMTGIPDRLCLLSNGRLFFAEIKASGQKPRPLQLYIHKKLQALGFKVYVIDSKKQVKEVLAEYGI